MGVNSKQKGGRFERAICKWFTSWTGYEFNRVPASGGLRWKNADNITSDVACTDAKHSRRFNLSIECKSYNDLRFEHILLGMKSCKIVSFWEQACRDAQRGKKLPMLIMKYNGMPKGEAFVIVTKELYKNCISGSIKPKKPIMSISPIISSEVYIFMLSDLKSVNYKEFHKLASQLRSKTYSE